MPLSQMRCALEANAARFVGVGQLAVRLPEAYFPQPRPFGFHVVKAFAEEELEPAELLHGCIRDARSDRIAPGDDLASHCNYAIEFEFPWFPLFVALSSSPTVREALAESIMRHVKEGKGRRWWFAYELLLGRLPIPDSGNILLIPFLPPERFFCTVGSASPRHGVVDNLLGGKDFCPFVEKFAGAADASEAFRAELLDVLSPICMMTVKDFLKDAEISHGSLVDDSKMDRLAQKLAHGDFAMTEAERGELQAAFGLSRGRAQEILTAARLVEFAQWLRGDSRLAARLREHLLGVTPADLRWHAPGEIFLDRLSRVISTVETRASQMIEGELPPSKKERFFVDVISQPWNRDDIVIDAPLIYNLQRGLLSPERFEKVCKTQVEGEPRRKTQNWISSERHDDMVGKEKVLHYLPPPPEMLPTLYAGYFECMQRVLADPVLDPIICATIAKIALNTLHPMADGNGRVQRMLFQLILFKFKFLPRVNVPVSVIMLRDRTAYEVLQQGHVDQIMAGLAHHKVVLEGEDEESFQHVNVNEGVLAAYQFQDFTFAASCMIKLMQNTLPVIAAKAYFLRRFDWRVDELLKDDALLPPRAATKIAKAFKNDPASRGISYAKLLRLLFMDGWWIGFRRIAHFLRIAKHPDDALGVRHLWESAQEAFSRSNRRLWLRSSGQLNPQFGIVDTARSTGGRMRWVSISLDKFAGSEIALKRALQVSLPGDAVLAVHYPMVMKELVSDGVFPELRDDLLAEIAGLRRQIIAVTKNVVESHKKDGVHFQALVGDGGGHAYKPATSLCHDLKSAELKPFRIYVGYDQAERHHKFTDYIVQNAPCDVAIVKNDLPSPVIRWVGISARNLQVSANALAKAFHHSSDGDTVVAVHYPANPFVEEGLSSVYESHFTSVCGDNLDIIMDSMGARVVETANRVAEEHGKEGVTFKLFVGGDTSEPHRALVRDATLGVEAAGISRPHTIYVGYSQRRDRARLVDPQKLYDVAEHIVHKSPCNVVVVKRADTKP